MKVVEFNNTNHFLRKELPESVGLKFIPIKLRKYFEIHFKNGIWVRREKK